MLRIIILAHAISVGSSVAEIGLGPVIAQVEPTDRGPGPDAAPVDLGRELLKREANAQRDRREAMFEKLRVLPLRLEPEREIQVILRWRAVELQRRVRVVDDARADPEDDEGPPPRQRSLLPARFFDDLMFGGGREADLRSRLLALLEQRVKELEQSFSLTNVQRQKLRLAGRGDIKRIFDEIAEERRQFDHVSVGGDEVDLKAFLSEITPLRARLSTGLFDTQSLFSKTFKKMYEEKQLMRRRANDARQGAIVPTSRR